MTRLVLDTQALGTHSPKTQSIMLLVIAALVPGIAALCVFISPVVLVNVLAATIAAILFESIAAKLRGANALSELSDCSIILAAVLLAVAVPPMLPIWQLFIGVFIMVMLGKHVYGGIGHNPFNPAMVGYAALLVSFPVSMTMWMNTESLSAVDFATLVRTKLSLELMGPDSGVLWDGITQATPLDHMRSLRTQAQPLIPNELMQRSLDSGWLWVNASFLFGGLFLLYKNIIRWHIPVSVLFGYLLWFFLFSNSALPFYYSVFSGALILGAFFIATDPVTAASSNRGRLVFGFGIGSLTFVIREYAGYPEGIAFAVLLMNLCVPLIDHLELQWSARS